MVGPLQHNGSRGRPVIASNHVDAADDRTIAGYFTTEQYAQQHPDVVQGFAAAMKKSAEVRAGQPDVGALLNG